MEYINEGADRDCPVLHSSLLSHIVHMQVHEIHGASSEASLAPLPGYDEGSKFGNFVDVPISFSPEAHEFSSVNAELESHNGCCVNSEFASVPNDFIVSVQSVSPSTFLPPREGFADESLALAATEGMLSLAENGAVYPLNLSMTSNLLCDSQYGAFDVDAVCPQGLSMTSNMLCGSQYGAFDVEAVHSSGPSVSSSLLCDSQQDPLGTDTVSSLDHTVSLNPVVDLLQGPVDVDAVYFSDLPGSSSLLYNSQQVPLGTNAALNMVEGSQQALVDVGAVYPCNVHRYPESTYSTLHSADSIAHDEVASIDVSSIASTDAVAGDDQSPELPQVASDSHPEYNLHDGSFMCASCSGTFLRRWTLERHIKLCEANWGRLRKRLKHLLQVVDQSRNSDSWVAVFPGVPHLWKRTFRRVEAVWFNVIDFDDLDRQQEDEWTSLESQNEVMTVTMFTERIRYMLLVMRQFGGNPCVRMNTCYYNYEGTIYSGRIRYTIAPWRLS